MHKTSAVRFMRGLRIQVPLVALPSAKWPRSMQPSPQDTRVQPLTAKA